MNKLFASIVLRAALLLAATAPAFLLADQPEFVIKVVHIHYGSCTKLRDLIRPSTHATITVDNVLKVLVLSGRPEDVAVTERLIQELDQPTKGQNDANNIEVTVYVIGANSKSVAGPEQPMPPALDPVVKQIRAAFPYRTFQLLTSSFTRSRIGEKLTNQGFFALGDNKASYDEGFDHSEIVAGNGQASIHLSKFHFYGRVLYEAGQHEDIEVSTDLDLRENQKVVVGKAGTGSDDSAIFIVLTAKVVD